MNTESSCSHCSKVFSRKSSLKRHIEIKHPELKITDIFPGKKFQCKSSAKEFNNKKSYISHGRKRKMMNARFQL
ncbi:hypothetical protein HUJ04_001454 [Dendroctonus ponderosae]|nr:hypothetical protein HUJ04_001454 [Dendroctonus ponderosae]